MSYEGFYEYLCEKGHYVSRDAYDETVKKCPRCGGVIAFRHSVDQTNGYDESNPNTCIAPKEEIGHDDIWKTDHYGNSYAEKLKRFRPLAEWKPS